MGEKLSGVRGGPKSSPPEFVPPTKLPQVRIRSKYSGDNFPLGEGNNINVFLCQSIFKKFAFLALLCIFIDMHFHGALCRFPLAFSIFFVSHF